MSERPTALELSDVTQALRALVAASHESGARLAREQQFNLTDSMALETLDRRGPLGAQELANALGIRSGSATVLIDRLERRGYVERRRDPDDRRRVTVVARPEALADNLVHWAPGILAIDEVAAALSADEREIVKRYLVAVTAALGRS